jgi:AbrB family looped-hinge helix DNA binding protein
MPSTVVTTKGQVTIPVEVRRDLGLNTGDRLEFTRNPDTGGYVMTRKTGSIMDLVGILKYDGPPVTIEQMKEEIAQAAVDRYLASESGD